MTRTSAQYLFKGNVIACMEDVTGGYAWTDEGRVSIISEVTFTVIYKNLRFGIEAHWVEDDHDMYSISIFDQSAEPNKYRREDSNEICHCFLDSTGGGTCDETISTGYEVVDNAICSILFGNKELGIEPYIKPF